MVSAIASLTASILPAFLTGALAVQIGDDLDIGTGELGVALGVFYLLSAVTSLHAGEFADRIGPRRALQIANLLSGLCLLGVAALAWSFPALLAILVVGSAGLTVAGPGTKVVVARYVTPARHGVAFGVQMSAIPLAALLGGLAVPSIGLTLGWRWAFVIALVVPLLGLLTLPPEPATPAPPAAPSADRAAGGRFAHVDLRPLLVLGVAATLGCAAATTTSSFFVVAATDTGFAEGTAGLMLSAVSAAVIAFRILFGSVADRYESGHPQAVTALFVLSTVGYLLLATGSKALFPMGGFVALAFGWAWTGLLVFTVVRHHPDAPGLASSVIVGGLNLGSVLGPLLFGILVQHVATETAFLVTGGWTLVAAVACWVGTKRLEGAVAGVDREPVAR
jgi:predicted MFS family arabinose efflux permease